MKQFKNVLFFLFAALIFTSCQDGKLPNASITGATAWDYVPYVMMGIGVMFMGYCGIDQLKNGEVYTDKKLNPSVTRFVFGWGGFVLLILGLLIAFS